MESLMGKIKAHSNAIKKTTASNDMKRKARKLKKAKVRTGQKKALPTIRSVSVPKNYVSHITQSPMKDAVFYMLTNRGTGRKNYFTKSEISKIVGRSMSNYNLLMADPKKALFRNPVTRNPVYPRNLQRVRPR